ncbi:hypothetical protein BHM03_00024373 [Ensete ventricosum]|nr:hypothetical protein BHM03_00024373 [Ensete ventricosum]
MGADPTEQGLKNLNVVRADPTEQELRNWDGSRADLTEHELGNWNDVRADLTEHELGNWNVARTDPTEQELGNWDGTRADLTEHELGNWNLGFCQGGELGRKSGDLAERVNSGANPGIWPSPCALARPRSAQCGVGVRSDGWNPGVRLGKSAAGMVEVGQEEAPQVGSGVDSCKEVGSGAYIVGVVDHPYLTTWSPLWLTMPSYTSTTPAVLAMYQSVCRIALVDKGAKDFKEKIEDYTHSPSPSRRRNFQTSVDKSRFFSPEKMERRKVTQGVTDSEPVLLGPLVEGIRGVGCDSPRVVVASDQQSLLLLSFPKCLRGGEGQRRRATRTWMRRPWRTAERA